MKEMTNKEHNLTFIFYAINNMSAYFLFAIF